MKWLDDLQLWLIPIIIYLLNIVSNRWTRLKVYGQENIHQVREGTPVLFAFWHGKLWIPAYYFKGRGYLVLSSLSRDGEYMTRVLKRYGYRVVRGSSSRGGGRALLKLVKLLKKGAATFITPDGPTGPIYKVKPGIVYLQEKCNGVIIPIGVAIDRKKTFNSWDRLVFPLPGTRAVLVFGEPLRLPQSKTIEERCWLLEEEINRVQAQAENYLTNS
ncbi:MAG: hypothetical protein PWR10_1025 [Halanaerobiales bacterium]|nr:hypothetical protein [Halanaerobiales bacterium]